jgi:hypothetical protein
LAAVMDADEAFDEGYSAEKRLEPPISVPRYRRAVRLPLTVDFTDEVTPPAELSESDQTAFEEGVAACQSALIRRFVAILTGS